VKRIDPAAGSRRGRTPTPLCSGPMADVLASIEARGIEFFRARVMRLRSGSFEMKFHRDAEVESWRLHVPIITTPESHFEWQRPDGTITGIHMPADGTAWLVRVDQRHRAVNRAPTATQRVHLLMSLARRPPAALVEDPVLLDP